MNLEQRAELEREKKGEDPKVEAPAPAPEAPQQPAEEAPAAPEAPVGEPKEGENK